MWARHPKNLPPISFTSDVMRDKSDRPINPEIGNHCRTHVPKAARRDDGEPVQTKYSVEK